MILGNIPIDVVKPPIANLHVDLAHKKHTEKANKYACHGRASSSLQPVQKSKTYDPCCNVPMRCPTTLILRLADILKDLEEPVPEAIGKEHPHTPHYVIHVQRHDVSACKHAIRVWHEEIRLGEFPLGWCNGDKEVWESTQPHLTPQITTVIIQKFVVLFIKAPHQHDTHQVC